MDSIIPQPGLFDKYHPVECKKPNRRFGRYQAKSCRARYIML
jgi:hypothetical protein